MSGTVVYCFSATTAAILDGWRAELAAMPARERKNWKGILSDKWNVRQKVRWLGKVYTADVGDGVSVQYEFACYKHADKVCGSTWVPVIDLACQDLLEAPKILTDAGRRLLDARRDGEDMSAVFRDIQAENSTGNHYRNPRPVKVATKAGEPVRG